MKIFTYSRKLNVIYNLKRTITSLVNENEVKQFIKAWTEKFKINGVEDIEFTLKCIGAHILKKPIALLHNVEQESFTKKQLIDFERLSECRLAKMPLQYIIGEWDFHNLTLKMQPPVFIPRPETENLVEIILKHTETQYLSFLEVGCGSGAICLSILAHDPTATSIALDRSALACNLTMINAKHLNVADRIQVYKHTVLENSLLPEKVDKKYQLIVSNPPYIKTRELLKLAPEIYLYENLTAVDGGPDGLAVVRVLLKLASEKLTIGGHLWLELDPTQIPLLKQEIESNYADLRFVSDYKDMFGKQRFAQIERI